MMIVNNWQRLVNISSTSCSAVTESVGDSVSPNGCRTGSQLNLKPSS